MARCKHCTGGNKYHTDDCPRPRCVKCLFNTAKAKYRGLCCSCYLRHKEGYEPEPEKQPGDAEFRCRWCAYWRVNVRMTICSQCQQEFSERLATMPALLRKSELEVAAE